MRLLQLLHALTVTHPRGPQRPSPSTRKPQHQESHTHTPHTTGTAGLVGPACCTSRLAFSIHPHLLRPLRTTFTAQVFVTTEPSSSCSMSSANDE
eukprot:1873481-Prymnesium_polylepis.2